MIQIALKRAYEDPEGKAGHRILVDRIWPRGVGKKELQLADWLKEIAPSTKLRKWFDHDPEKWHEFKRRYFSEMDGHTDLVETLLSKAEQGRVTLVYGASDEKHNNALALKGYLESQAKE